MSDLRKGAAMDWSCATDVLREPMLAALLDETLRDYIDWSQLGQRPLPTGLTREQTWELLGVVRHFGSTTFPIATHDRRPFWYSMTREGTHCVQFIQHHCRSDSELHRTMLDREGQRFLVRSRIQEAVATCQLDGVAIPYGRARKLLEDRRSPRTASERLVLNSYEMLHELDSLVDEPFSPELVTALYERLTHGVALDEIERGPRKSNLAGVLNPAEMAQMARERGVLGDICDYANGRSGDPDEPTAIRAYMLLSSMGYWQPLPDLNETVARHLLRLYAVKRDYPVLGYLSLSLTILRWFDGTLKTGTTRFDHLERRSVLPGTIDGTEDILTYLQLTTAAIGALLAYVQRTRSQDAALSAALESQQRLNYRQRSVLSRALAHPDAEFRIRPHQTAHHVVYQTARADLLDLVARGYLVKEERGKAFVFLAASDLEDRIAGPSS